MRLRLLPRHLVLVFLAAFSIALPARVLAQAGTSGLTGAVTDPSGTAMDRVHIVVLDPATGFSRETDTNNTGNYNIPGLRPGTYSVVATRDGFRTFTETAFRVEVGQIARLDVRLEIGAVSEVVEVAGRAQMLQTEAATLSGVIDSQKIAELPLNGRNFVQLALLVPGVNTGQPGAGRGGGISINGTRSEQNSFQLDGVTNTNQWDCGHLVQAVGGLDPGIQDRGEQLRGRVRPRRRRPDQRGDEVGHERPARDRLRVQPQRRAAGAELLRPESELRRQATGSSNHLRSTAMNSASWSAAR